MGVGIGGGGGSTAKKTPSIGDFTNSTTRAIAAKNVTPPAPNPAAAPKPPPGATVSAPAKPKTTTAAKPKTTTAAKAKTTTSSSGTTSASGSGSYTVRSGDSLSAIAQRNGMTLAQLLALNPQYKANPNMVQTGATLKLSGASTGTTTPGATPEPSPVPAPAPLPGLNPTPTPAPTPAPAPLPAGPPEPTGISGLPQDQRNALEMLNDTFKQYGLDSLGPKILDYVKQGYDPATTSIMLQNTDEWKTRFAGNEARRAAGLPVLSPAEYLATESAMKGVLKNYGLPSSFYDQPGDFAQLIGNNVSPDEVASRARYAWDFTKSSGGDDAKQLLKDYYGVDDSHIAAYFLDPTKGQALIERAGHSIEMGRAAARQGLDIGKNFAEKYTDMGITSAAAESGFANAASILEPTTAIAHRFGEQYGLSNAIEETVGGLASEKRKRAELAQKEQSLFAGSAAATKAFGAGTNQY